MEELDGLAKAALMDAERTVVVTHPSARRWEASISLGPFFAGKVTARSKKRLNGKIAKALEKLDQI